MNAEIKNELTVDERREKILGLLNQKGKVRVGELSKLFAISEVTIRIDLSELETAGMVERVHGGAISVSKAYYSMSLQERMRTNETEKRRIARAVAGMVSDGDTIMLNSGTTTLFTVQELHNIRDLTIVTNSIAIAKEVGHKGYNIIVLGGCYNAQYQFTYGDDTINQLRKYKADKLILAVDGISADDGIATYLHFEAEVDKQMISRVKRTIVVADYAKVGRVSFANIDTVSVIDTLVTDTRANPDDVRALIDKGLEVQQV